jgi:ribosomal protein L40E
MPKGWKTTESPRVSSNSVAEQVIWRNEVTKGIFNRRVVEVQIITNQRVCQNSRAIFLKDLDDIIVMNQHRESQGQSARYYARGFGASYGTGRSSGKTIGDVAFIYQGQPSIVFNQISDPYGVTRLAKAVRRSSIQQIKLVEKMDAKLEKEREVEARLAEKSQKRSFHSKKNKSEVLSDKLSYNLENSSNPMDIICQKCGNANPQDAKFCGMCGVNITSSCSKCGRLNPTGSGFCNSCGFTLA